jgi:Domain of unknown function (DUF4338)/DDE_Tnp_1-associated/Transposase DDE domain
MQQPINKPATGTLHFITITTTQEIAQFNELLKGEHYLGASPSIGDFLRQVAVENGEWVGLLAWGPAAYRLKDRDHWIGWDPTTRQERLKLVIQNRRFLILEKKRRPNLASQVLGAAVRCLPDEWEKNFGYRPVLAETFTDMEAFEGTCYKAAGWLPLGVCKGHRRHRVDYYIANNRPKKLWVKPLMENAQQQLCSGQDLAQKSRVPTGQLPIKDPQLVCLREAFLRIKDPRKRNSHFRIAPMLTLIAMAILCGRTQLSEIARFAHLVSQNQRGKIGLPKKKGSKFYKVPTYGTFYYLLSKLNREEFSLVLSQWIQEQRGELPSALALDGKSVRDRVMMVTLADEQGSPVSMEICEGKGHEMKAGQNILEKTQGLNGSIVTADALHCQKKTATLIVEKGADYILQIKGNQESLLELAQKQLEGHSPFLPKSQKDTVAMKKEAFAKHGSNPVPVGSLFLDL